MDKSGTAYFTHSFIGDWDFDDLFSSFMSAFNTFTGEIFSKSIDRVKVGDNTILINPVESFSICYLFKGQTYHAKQKLNKFADTIQKEPERWETLEKFEKSSQVAELRDLPNMDKLLTNVFLN